MYDLVVVLVSPDEADPVCCAVARLAAYIHKDDCGPEPCGNGCWWDGCALAGKVRAFSGGIATGSFPADHPIKSPADEARRAGDIDIRLVCLGRKVPGALTLPDGQLRWVGQPPRPMIWELPDVARYEDLMSEFPDHIAVPMGATGSAGMLTVRQSPQVIGGN
jgi:hypothetical protein